MRVRVPATSANLGPGFDTLGLALAIHDEVEAHAADGTSVEVTGEGAGDVPRDESHLIIRTIRTALDRLGAAQPAGVALRCTNRIPHARGLGSSSAAIVAGILLARGLAGRERDDVADLTLASEIEGHPDNVAPCLLGGLTVAWTADDGARAIRLQPERSVRPVVFIPPFEASTEAARGLLPKDVPHVDAVFNASRAALLVAALTGRPDTLLPATDDRLHQPYRAPAMRESADLVAVLRTDGRPAVISGAGPTVLVLARDEDEAAAARKFVPDGWRVESPDIDSDGAADTRE